MSTQRVKRVVGNWKMHGRLDGNRALLNEVLEGAKGVQAGVEIGVCVPFPYLAQVGELLQGSRVVRGRRTCRPTSRAPIRARWRRR